MPVAAIAAIGSAVAGGVASHSAAGAQQDAAAQATAERRRQFDEAKNALSPWMIGGQQAYGALTGMTMPGGELWKNFEDTNWQADPGYQFRLAEGQKALERSAAAKGMTFNGGTLKALTGYNQGMASDEYGKAYDRFNNNRTLRYNMLSGVSGQGLSAAGSLAGASIQTGNGIANDALYAGNARASGYMGMANVAAGLGQNVLDYYNSKRD